MAISKINKIRKFGIFSDFRWQGSIPDFKQHNIFYGWNYSGKTTIARVFACFENRKLHDDYPDAEFELIDDNGHRHSNNNLDSLPNIKVFSVDFVEKNLGLFQSGSEIEPILILGEENVELQKKLDVLIREDKELQQINEKIVGEKQDNDKQLNTAYSRKAKHIKETLVLPDYEKRNLEPKVKELIGEHKKFILGDEDYKKNLATYQSQEEKDSIFLPSIPDLDFLELGKQVKALVEKQITAKSIIAELKDNPGLNAWVKEGKVLHEAEETCKFCGNRLPDGLIERLNEHFSEEYSKHEMEISIAISNLQGHQITLRDFQAKLPDRARLYVEFSNEYQNLKDELDERTKVYMEGLTTLINSLESKKNAPFSSISFLGSADPSPEVVHIYSELKKIVEKHNKKTTNFSDEKEKAKEALLKHFAASFVEENDLLSFGLKQETLSKKLEENRKLMSTKTAEIQEIEAKLSDSAKGAMRVNHYIQTFFRHDGIRLEVADTDKFRLIRDEKPAKNLSEGEKTVIALAYFIASLEDGGGTPEDSVVFIDDPVSSLDSNHLFNIYALIKSELENCQQLFVSTHNMDFFNLIKDFLNEKYGGWSRAEKERMPCYMVQREWNPTIKRSVILDLPGVLKRYRSEYAYLFGLLKEFHENDDASLERHKLLYLIPNVARRFLEGYLGMRYPDGKSWTGKLNRLISDETKEIQVKKFVDEFSHNQSSERSLKFPEPVECKEVVANILAGLQESDTGHYDALCIGA